MATYEVRARAKNHWWNFWDEIQSKLIAPDSNTAVLHTRQYWRGQGVKHFQLISAKRVED